MKFTFKQFIVPNFWKRLAFMLPAVILMGVFVSILIEVGWGTDPASFMNLNIARATGISLGTTEVIVYGIMLVFTFIFGAQMIGFGTIANMVLIGYIADFCAWLWKQNGFHDAIQNGSIGFRIVIYALAIIFFVIAAAVYMNAQMGTAPYDSTSYIISGWMPKVPFFVVRIIYDLFWVGVGVIASLFNPDGMQGSLIGSIIMSFLIGPAVSLVGKPLKKIL